MPVLPVGCRWPCRLIRLLAGGVRFDEGGDPVVQLVDPVEAAVAARDDGDLRVRHKAPRARVSAEVSMALRAPVISRTGTVIARSSSSVRTPGNFVSAW